MQSRMLTQMLYVQWRWSRDMLAFFVVAGFAIPLVIFRMAMPMFGTPTATDLIGAGQIVGGFCLGLALLAGGALALQGYGMDDRAGHIYALSLPVTRARFLASRSAAAFALLALPALAIWLGGLVVASQVITPPTISPYAGSLALRAALAAWLAHACVFALRYSALRRAKVVLLVLLLVLVATSVVMLASPGLRGTVEHAAKLLSTYPGPFGVLYGRWTLFDI